MTPAQQRELAAPLVEVYEALEDDLLTLVAKQLGRYGGITETADWQLKQLASMGALNQKTIRIIAQRTGIVPELLMVAVENAAWAAITEMEPALQGAARAGLDRTQPTAAEDTVMQVAKTYQSQAQDAMNLVNTVMQYKVRESFQKAVNKVFAADAGNRRELLQTLGKHTASVVTGARSRQDALRACIREMAEQGIPAFVDRSGREWTPEAYINMDIRTTVSNTAHAAQFARMDEYGVDLVAVSSHIGARPLCAKDQGKLFSRSNKSGYTTDLHGKRIRYYPWSSSSFGEPAGLLGINCGHHIYPFIPGLSRQSYEQYDKDENDEAYQLSQKQRSLERQVRKAKRECMMLDAAGDKEGFRQASVRLRDRKRALNSFLEESGRTMRADRTQVVGFNRSLAGKTNAAVEKYSKIRYHKDGTIVVTDDWKPKGKVNNVPKKYISNAVVETQTTYKDGTVQVDRTLYDADGIMYKQIHSGPHNRPDKHPFGQHGEHSHSYQWTEDGKLIDRTPHELTEQEKTEHADILGGGADG